MGHKSTARLDGLCLPSVKLHLSQLEEGVLHGDAPSSPAKTVMTKTQMSTLILMNNATS